MSTEKGKSVLAQERYELALRRRPLRAYGPAARRQLELERAMVALLRAELAEGAAGG